MNEQKNVIGEFILREIRKRPNMPTKVINDIQDRDRVTITKEYIVKVPSTFWWQPKRTLVVLYEDFQFFFVYSGIIGRWRFARKNEIRNYNMNPLEIPWEGEHGLS